LSSVRSLWLGIGGLLPCGFLRAEPERVAGAPSLPLVGVHAIPVVHKCPPFPHPSSFLRTRRSFKARRFGALAEPLTGLRRSIKLVPRERAGVSGGFAPCGSLGSAYKRASLAAPLSISCPLDLLLDSFLLLVDFPRLRRLLPSALMIASFPPQFPAVCFTHFKGACISGRDCRVPVYWFPSLLPRPRSHPHPGRFRISAETHLPKSILMRWLLFLYPGLPRPRVPGYLLRNRYSFPRHPQLCTPPPAPRTPHHRLLSSPLAPFGPIPRSPSPCLHFRQSPDLRSLSAPHAQDACAACTNSRINNTSTAC